MEEQQLVKSARDAAAHNPRQGAGQRITILVTQLDQALADRHEAAARRAEHLGERVDL
jgi:hypothetical protein